MRFNVMNNKLHKRYKMQIDFNGHIINAPTVLNKNGGLRIAKTKAKKYAKGCLHKDATYTLIKCSSGV